MTTQTFAGWPAGAFDFLRELEANNDRDWFKANRARYDELLRDPTTALGEDLAKLGRTHMFRPFNDTRFHPGPPIKEHVGLAIGMGGAGGYYVEIVARRAARRGRPLQPAERPGRAAARGGRGRAQGGGAAARVDTAAASGLELGEPDLKRVPRGYPADHPRADLLRYRRLVVYRRVPLGEVDEHARGGRADRGRWIASATPLVNWMRANVGPSELPGAEPAGVWVRRRAGHAGARPRFLSSSGTSLPAFSEIWTVA